MNIFWKRLSFKYSWANAFIFAGVFLFIFPWIYNNTQNILIHSLEKDLAIQSSVILPTLPDSWTQKGDPRDLEAWSAEKADQFEVNVTITDAQGQVLADSKKTLIVSSQTNISHLPDIAQALQKKVSTRALKSSIWNFYTVYFTAPVQDTNDHLTGVLRLSKGTENLSQIIRSNAVPVFTGLFLGIVLLFTLNHFLHRSIQKRITRMTQAMKRFMKNDPDQSQVTFHDDEFDPMVRALNQTGLALRSRMKDLAHEKTKLSLLLENLTDGVVALNLHRDVLWMNSMAKELLGIQGRLIQGQSFIELTRNTQIDELLAKALRQGRTVKEEIVLPYPSHLTLQVYALAPENLKEDIAAILVLNDITEIRKLENVRKDFVANVSHEIKTPLTSLLGFIETLLGGADEDPETRRHFLNIMKEDSRRLHRLITDLLDLARLESNQMHLDLKPIALKSFCEQILENFRLSLIEKQIKTAIHISPSVEVMADSDKLKQVLVNVIDNAIKFNRQEGTIMFWAERASPNVLIAVEDNGPGMPEEMIPRIFERFYRGDKARTRDAGGTGLGLSIVKHIIEAHGGQVSCKSELGKGTSILFSLPSA